MKSDDNGKSLDERIQAFPEAYERRRREIRRVEEAALDAEDSHREIYGKRASLTPPLEPVRFGET